MIYKDPDYVDASGCNYLHTLVKIWTFLGNVSHLAGVVKQKNKQTIF